jgi:hypothetical protein
MSISQIDEVAAEQDQPDHGISELIKQAAFPGEVTVAQPPWLATSGAGESFGIVLLAGNFLPQKPTATNLELKKSPTAMISEWRAVIAAFLPGTVDDVSRPGMLWLKDKDQGEVAKAMEIRASAMERLRRLELDAFNLIQEQVEVLSGVQTGQGVFDLVFKRVLELTLEELKAVAEASALAKDMNPAQREDD